MCYSSILYRHVSKCAHPYNAAGHTDMSLLPNVQHRALVTYAQHLLLPQLPPPHHAVFNTSSLYSGIGNSLLAHPSTSIHTLQ